MSFPRYPNYKDSGVEWVGEVPAHWEVTSIKRLASVRYGIGEPPAYHAEGVPLIRATNVHAGMMSLDGVVLVRPEDIPTQRIVWLEIGDIIVVRSGAYTGDSAIVPSGFPRSIAGFDMVLRCNGVLPAFMQACLLSYYVKQRQIDVESTRAAQPHLNAEELGACTLLLPPLEEQAAIASFLDRETAKIDALVAEQQRLVDLLKEKRQAVISHAVTKGLNPDAPMKPSGVEWLGDVPAHWEVKPIRKAAKLESGHTPSRQHPEYWQNCTVPWFTLADVWQIREEGADYITETKEKVSDVGLANSSARTLPKGTVMLSRTASVGFSAIMGVDMATTQDFANWVCGPSLLPEFLLQVLRSMRSEFDRMMMGSTHNTIYMPDIQALRFVLPPMAEQAAIVEFVGKETCKIDSLSTEAERAITLLQERRTALISAAVTGQIDVRGLTATGVA